MHPELILINVITPRLDGLETTRRLRRPGERVAIIAMSASVFEANRAQCLQAGCDDSIPKRYRPRICSTRCNARSSSIGFIRRRSRRGPDRTPAGGERGSHLGSGAQGTCERHNGTRSALEALGEPYLAFARQLHELAKQFRFDEICVPSQAVPGYC